MKRIAILGSTGSIGTQALNVIRRHPDRFSVEVLCAGSNADLLIAQALEFDPNAVAIADESQYPKVQEALAPRDIKVFAGQGSIIDLMSMESIDLVLAAIVGFAGLRPTLAAIEHHKPVALANKETMVVAGAIVTEAARRHRVPILPVDSEHSAIFQSL
ncbi:MAG: 1-deoxy-D-xylulose-5-phosphate reductoisomerase, partial [Bacteroidales bacterium]|nr:1-deoxy-D-xylulose-5-phosphate reductoisomerase [Bacteroidales bacterium]